MADGEVLINTKIQTEDAKEDLKELKNDLKDFAESAEESSQKTKKSTADLVEDLPESYQNAYKKIEQIRNDDALDSETKVDRIAEQFESLGQTTEDAISNAWNAVKHEGEIGSNNVINNLEDIAREARETGDALEDMAGGISSGGAMSGGTGGLLAGFIGGISGALVRAGLDLLKEAGQAVVEFGKESIELASDLQEVQNVVDVTFKTMSGQVDDFARNAIKSAGMSETMAKQYVGTFGAMADSFGFTEQEAYDMATSLTQLTGDVASFYNLDHDEANTKLKAVFTGETEALKELGVVMTQTALDQFALEQGFGKTTKEMTEQEKVSLRYKFVMDKLSGASGDFVRTQDSWANQTRILSEQWAAFQTQIGIGLLEIFTPFVEFLNNAVMPALLAFGDWFAGLFADDPVGELANDVDALGAELSETAEITDIAAESLDGMEESVKTAEEAIEELKQQYEETKESAKDSLNSQIGLLTELETKSEKSALQIVNNWKKQQSALQNYATNLRKAITMGLDEALVKQLADGTNESMLILNEFVNGTGVSIKEINKTFRGVQQSKEIVSTIMADIQTDFRAKMAGLTQLNKAAWGNIADITEDAVKDIQDSIDSIEGKTVAIDVVYGNDRPKLDFSSYNPPRRSYSTSSYSLPALATGAVIPPNAPFTAILGDQRNGYNLEGPEDMFRSIVREEIANSQSDETPELLRELIAVVSNMEIDGQSLFDIVVDRNNRASRNYGVSPLKV